MENLFKEEIFFCDLSDVMDYYDIDEDEFEELDDDWKIELQTSTLEPMFQLTEQVVIDAILQHTDTWEDRFPEDDDSILNKLEIAVKSGIDINKINEAIPKLYYPNGGKIIVTKQDLIDYCK
jgi:uncharacterized protein YutE (UPF0331/DUF86 family)